MSERQEEVIRVLMMMMIVKKNSPSICHYLFTYIRICSEQMTSKRNGNVPQLPSQESFLDPTAPITF